MEVAGALGGIRSRGSVMLISRVDDVTGHHPGPLNDQGVKCQRAFEPSARRLNVFGSTTDVSRVSKYVVPGHQVVLPLFSYHRPGSQLLLGRIHQQRGRYSDLDDSRGPGTVQ